MHSQNVIDASISSEPLEAHERPPSIAEGAVRIDCHEVTGAVARAQVRDHSIPTALPQIGVCC
jgi:hypothetical protein